MPPTITIINTKTHPESNQMITDLSFFICIKCFVKLFIWLQILASTKVNLIPIYLTFFNPILSALFITKSYAAWYSFGISPSNIASFTASFKTPISLEGFKVEVGAGAELAPVALENKALSLLVMKFPSPGAASA